MAVGQQRQQDAVDCLNVRRILSEQIKDEDFIPSSHLNNKPDSSLAKDKKGKKERKEKDQTTEQPFEDCHEHLPSAFRLQPAYSSQFA